MTKFHIEGIDMTELKAKPHHCEEAHHTSAIFYIPCDAPARQVVLADGKELRMCDACAHHSVKNRGMKIVREYGAAADELLVANTGGNNPPDPIDEAIAPYGDALSEAENWLDGTPVKTEAQMIAVDALLKEIKAAEKAVTKAKESEAAPLHDAWKAALARYKPTLDDLDRIKKGLIATVDAFKRKLAQEKAAKEAAARAAAESAAQALRDARANAEASDIAAQRAIADAEREAEIARINAAVAAKQNTVAGMTTKTFHEVTDHKALLNWIAVNRRDDMTAFIEEWARKNHSLGASVPGLRVWQEKVAK